jgi:prolyl oligopeptidase
VGLHLALQPVPEREAGREVPALLFTTSTRDDRVHPATRARWSRDAAQGHDVLYYENIEGGHAGAADNGARAHVGALTFTYLRRQLAR